MDKNMYKYEIEKVAGISAKDYERYLSHPDRYGSFAKFVFDSANGTLSNKRHSKISDALVAKGVLTETPSPFSKGNQKKGLAKYSKKNIDMLKMTAGVANDNQKYLAELNDLGRKRKMAVNTAKGITGLAALGAGAYGLKKLHDKKKQEKTAYDIVNDSFEKIALTKEDIQKSFDNSFSKIQNPLIDNSKTINQVSKRFTMPWNEYFTVSTSLKNNNNELLTEDYFTEGNNNDDEIISRVIGSGKPFKKEKNYRVVADGIAVKKKFRKQGIARSYLNALEQAGMDLGANKLVLSPGKDGVDVWTKDNFNMHISERDKEQFINEYKKFINKNGGKEINGETLLSKYPRDFVLDFISNKKSTLIEKPL